jgi:hypothetical protein
MDVPMHAELRVVVEQVHAVLGVVEDWQQQQQQEVQAPPLGVAAVAALAASGGSSAEPPPELSAILEALRKATARNNLAEAAALQRQLAAALGAAGADEAASGAASQQGHAHGAAFEVHQFAELHIQDVKVGALPDLAAALPVSVAALLSEQTANNLLAGSRLSSGPDLWLLLPAPRCHLNCWPVLLAAHVLTLQACPCWLGTLLAPAF